MTSGATTRWALAAIALAVVAACASAALTRPFTWPANVVTALALVAMVVVVLLQQLGRDGPRHLLRRRPRPPGPAPGPWGWRWAIWIAPLTAAAVWEAFCYVASPRASHPTVSSMLDTVTATHAGRGIAFLAWLALGWYVVTR